MKSSKPSFPLNVWYAAAYDVEVTRIFREDEYALEAQQMAMDERPDHPFYKAQYRRRFDVGAALD